MKRACLGSGFVGAFPTPGLVPELSGSWLVTAAGRAVNVAQPVLHAASRCCRSLGWLRKGERVFFRDAGRAPWSSLGVRLNRR